MSDDMISRWLGMLAGLVNPMLPGEAAKALANLRPHLREFPASAFTAQTARDVAEAKRFGPVPAWDAIAPILRQAVRDARPINFGLLPAPVEPTRALPSEEEKARVAKMLADMRREQAEVADVMELKPGPLRDVSFRGQRLERARQMARGT